MSLKSLVCLVVSSASMMFSVAVAVHAAEPPIADESIKALHERIRQFDREVERRLTRAAQRAAEGAPQTPRSGDTEAFIEQLRYLELEIRRLGPVAVELLLPKLSMLENRMHDLRSVDERGAVRHETEADDPGRVGEIEARGVALPANDDCADAIEIGFGSFAGSTLAATNDGEASCGSSLFSPDVWFKLSIPATQTVFVDTLGSTFDTVLSVHTACPGTIGNQLVCNDDVFGSASAVSFTAGPAGLERWIRVSGFGGDAGEYLLNVGSGGGLSGTVLSSATSDPLPGIVVDLWGSEGFFIASQVTDSAGQYLFGNLTPGAYFASTRNAVGLLDEIYDDLPCPGGSFSNDCDPTTGTPILIENDATAAGIDFALDLGGTITGTVTDAAVDGGLDGVRVDIWNAAGSRVQAVFTDAFGDYAASGLEAGAYFASTDTGGFLNELYDDLPCPGGAPNGCDPTTGTVIAVQLGTTTSGIDFVLDRLGAIAGTVTEAGTGDPIASIRIEIRNASGSFVGSAQTSSDGSYSIGGLVTGTYFATAESFFTHVDELYDDLPCPGGPPFGCNVLSGTPIPVEINLTTPGIDFVLDRLATISGTVTEEGSGDPLPEIRLEVRSSAGFFVASEVTDAAGGYSADRLEPGTYFVVTGDRDVVNELYDDLPCEPDCVFTTGTAVPAEVNTVTDGIDFALVEKGAIGGSLSEAATGSPLAFQRVEIWDDDGSFVRSANTDAAGAYTVTGLDAGTYFATTDLFSGAFVDEAFDDLPCMGGAFNGCDPTAGTAIAVALSATTAGIDFALSLGGEISGSISEVETGDPIGGAEVEVFDAAGRQVRSAFTDADGVYLVTGLATGTYFLRTDTYVTYRDELYDDIPCELGCDPTDGTGVEVTIEETTTGIDFGLDRLGVISGTLTEAATGSAITSSRVEIYDANGVFVGADSTDASGDYAVGGLAAGTYFARTDLYGADFLDELFDGLACEGGCDPTTGTPIAVGISETVTGIDFALDRSGAISGIVTATAGGNLPGILIEVWNSSGGLVRSGTTDSAGIYTVGGLTAGSYFVTTRSALVVDELFDGLPCEGGCDPTAGTAVPVSLNTTTRHVDFALDLAGAISGVVTRAQNGGPIAGIRVALWDVNGGFVDSVSADASGLYLLAGLAPGTYFASTANFQGFLDELYDDQPCPGGATSGCDPTTGTPIPAAINTTTTGIDFELERLGALAGRVTDAATGSPISGIRVEIWNADSALVTSDFTDASGNYTATDLPSGTYFVSTDNFANYLDELYDDLPCFNGAPFGCEPDKGAPVLVANNATTQGIDFELLRIDTGLTGTVTAEASGEPQANVIVDIWSVTGQHVTSVATSAAGTYFASLSEATYFASTGNGVGLVDLVYDGRRCPGSAFAGACDPTAGTAIVVEDPVGVGDPGIVTGIDFALPAADLFADGFESGDTSAWSGTTGSP